MKNHFHILLTGIFVLAFHLGYSQHKFSINLNDIADDQFKVTVIPDQLTDDNDLFQFAATAPGTYQIMDIGRYVKSFSAYDADGNTLETEQISTNQWKLSEPSKIAKIEYSVLETWDNPTKEHLIYNMCGTSLEKDHAYISNQAVLGYFKGMQSHEIWIKLDYPEDWEFGSALTINDQGYYTAPTYDYAVDSPILLGRLSTATLDVEGTKIDVFTYSKTDMIKSDSILVDLKDILFAASKFTDGLPVDRYVFLFHFEDLDYGAWEHSYSSEYALKESELNEAKIQMIRSVVAHEFFHVVTPLNIHSELVEKFNFESPVFSQHLWLYEGVTEWSAWIMQLRNGIMPLDVYLDECSSKMKVNDNFDPSISLTTLGINAAEMEDQYFNIYHKGAMTATMLDLLLLKKSKGKRGLRELVNELADKYGPNQPFDEDTFFDELENMTYPEVGDFINNYIKGTEPLPAEEYFSYVGIDYKESGGYDSTKVSLGMGLNVNGQQQIYVAQMKDEAGPIKVGDILYKVNGVELTLQNAQSELGKFHQKKPGDKVDFIFIRDGEEVDIELQLPAQKITHVFTEMESPKKKQLKLRDKWMTNL